MKKKYLIASFICLTLNSYCQTYDLALELISPTSHSIVSASSNVSVDLKFSNFGPDNFPTGDSLMLVYQHQNQLYSLQGVSGSVTVASFPSAWNSGTYLTLNNNFGGAINLDLSLANVGDTVYFALFAPGLGSLSSPALNDTVIGNNIDYFIIGSSSAGIGELQLNMSIHPNPVTDELNVNISEELISISIFGLDGSLLENAENVIQMDCSKLKPGIYYCEIVTKSGKIGKKKFVKL